MSEIEKPRFYLNYKGAVSTEQALNIAMDMGAYMEAMGVDRARYAFHNDDYRAYAVSFEDEKAALIFKLRFADFITTMEEIERKHREALSAMAGWSLQKNALMQIKAQQAAMAQQTLYHPNLIQTQDDSKKGP